MAIPPPSYLSKPLSTFINEYVSFLSYLPQEFVSYGIYYFSYNCRDGDGDINMWEYHPRHHSPNPKFLPKERYCFFQGASFFPNFSIIPFQISKLFFQLPGKDLNIQLASYQLYIRKFQPDLRCSYEHLQSTVEVEDGGNFNAHD